MNSASEIQNIESHKFIVYTVVDVLRVYCAVERFNTFDIPN